MLGTIAINCPKQFIILPCLDDMPRLFFPSCPVAFFTIRRAKTASLSRHTFLLVVGTSQLEATKEKKKPNLAKSKMNNGSNSSVTSEIQQFSPFCFPWEGLDSYPPRLCLPACPYRIYKKWYTHKNQRQVYKF